MISYKILYYKHCYLARKKYNIMNTTGSFNLLAKKYHSWAEKKEQWDKRAGVAL